MNRYAFTILLFLIPLIGSAQKTTLIKGRVLESNTQVSIPGATILFINSKDSLDRTGTVTNNKGDFNLKVKPGQYDLSISFIGYQKINTSLTIDKKTVDIGQFKLTENKKMLEEIRVVETLPPTKQKGDTTIFNPEAYKVNPDASAEDLIAKMPGFFNINGKLSAQGQTVKEVLVDGKKFLGNDINKTLETIPSDVIKNVEVYEYKSDESKFTGFEDKEKKKTINIVTKQKSKHMRFGSLAAGMGKDEKYAIKANLNQFSENNRFTLTGNTKNVNAPLHLNRKRTFRRSINGNELQQNKLGLNFNTQGEQKNEFSAGYNYSDNETKNENRSLRTYTSYPLEGQTLSRESHSEDNEGSHNLNLYWEMNSHPKNQMTINSNLSTSDSRSKSTSNSETRLFDAFLNSNSNNKSQNNTSVNIDQHLYFSRMLNENGRTLSINASYNRNENDSDDSQISEIKGETEQTNQNIDQKSDNNAKSANFRAGLSFNEKIGKKGQLSVGYNYSVNTEKSKKSSYNLDADNQIYSQLDTLTSNQFKNSTTNTTGRLSYNHRLKNISVRIGADFQHTTLENEETFPKQHELNKTYFSVLPSAQISLTMQENKVLNILYRMGTSNPRAKQLQEIVNISNPLFISMGNSKLNQTSSHNLMVYYSASNMETGSFTAFNFNASKSNNIIGRRTIIALQDTLINNTYSMPKGGQFSQPTNLDGRYNLQTSFTYGIPIKKLQSKLNINTSANFSHNPTLVNNRKAFSNILSLDQDLKLSSNISERFDFTISSLTHYTRSKNTGQNSSGAKYLSQTNSLSLYWNFAKNLILKTSTNFKHRNNISSNTVENNCLLDIGLSCKVFKNKRGEISLVAYDILNQTSEKNHYVNDLYTSDNYSKKLNKFYMLSFTYKIRNKKNDEVN
ncbi:carboxypeptidase-like protein [Ancylomarina subtilis]|uniref:Carboxypeptidase-like protein n=1 Tax=Ancylomarina subtilis TaxID=1639035 RepID=A0A4Q7V3V2_9BACT|nr:TonB-dependent receptor [Ancylomarina subtilis]RZT91101.1 carboxypeptidase-like protein [Ancylomarina subtilis]